MRELVRLAQVLDRCSAIRPLTSASNRGRRAVFVQDARGGSCGRERHPHPVLDFEREWQARGENGRPTVDAVGESVRRRQQLNLLRFLPFARIQCRVLRRPAEAQAGNAQGGLADAPACRRGCRHSGRHHRARAGPRIGGLLPGGGRAPRPSQHRSPGPAELPRDHAPRTGELDPPPGPARLRDAHGGV